MANFLFKPAPFSKLYDNQGIAAALLTTFCQPSHRATANTRSEPKKCNVCACATMPRCLLTFVRNTWPKYGKTISNSARWAAGNVNRPHNGCFSSSPNRTSSIFRHKQYNNIRFKHLKLETRQEGLSTVNIIRRYSTSTRKDEDVMNVFDRKAKQLQRNRTALLDNYEVFDYLKEEIGWRMADRIEDIKRKFEVVVELGCGRGHISKHINDEIAGIWYQCDMAEKVLAQSSVSSEVPTYKLHVDEEFIPFPDSSIDLFISSLSLHWVNDLPGTFRQIHSALKNDGVFLGAMLGGDTLHQLRVSLQLAETDVEGGFSPHISPFTDVRDLGNLLTRANYNMITMDIDEITVNFPTMYELMKDLKGMGENNCSWNRRSILPRKTQEAAAAKYKEMYGNEDGSIPATFQIIYMIGWKPDPSQPKAAARGSGEVSIKDLDKLDQLSKEIHSLRDDTDKDKPS